MIREKANIHIDRQGWGNNGLTRERLTALWHGAALASLFFYPLLQALDSQRYYLFWERRDTLELYLAFAMLSTAFAAAWYALDRLASPRCQLVGVMALVLIPMTSFAVAIMRQMPIKETLIPLMAETSVRVGLLAIFGLAGTIAVAARPAETLKIVRGLLLLMSAVVLIVATTLVRLASFETHPTTFSTLPKATTGEHTNPSVFVFLFDELSYRFSHQDEQVRPELPNLRRFSEHATNYAAASAPGEETITSVPGLLAGRAFFDVDIDGDQILEVRADRARVPLDLQRPDSLFGLAKSRGLRTEVVGYFFPYCQLLAGVADSCRSFSWYNYSTVVNGFSPLNPVLTNLILWPYQAPFGVLKVPAFAQLQRRIVEQTVEAAMADLEPRSTRLRFVHLSVPHAPFVFDRDGYHPGDDPMREDAANYERQLQYTDRVVGTVLGALAKSGVFESSTIVIMSDHEYRWPNMVPSEASHIPLIIKRPGQLTRQNVLDPVRAERVLADLLTSR